MATPALDPQEVVLQQAALEEMLVLAQASGFGHPTGERRRRCAPGSTNDAHEGPASDNKLTAVSSAAVIVQGGKGSTTAGTLRASLCVLAYG